MMINITPIQKFNIHPAKLTWNPNMKVWKGLEDDLPFQICDF